MWFVVLGFLKIPLLLESQPMAKREVTGAETMHCVVATTKEEDRKTFT